MLIRPANKDDVDAIHRFVCELENEQFNFELFKKCYLQNISLPYHYYLIATDVESPVGYISCHGQILLHHLGLVYEIQELFVSKEYRGQGIGRQLLQAIEVLIGKEKYELLEVASNMRRNEAHQFYLKNGFEWTSYKFRKLP